jgi:endo-1,4-beta-xylanase
MHTAPAFKRGTMAFACAMALAACGGGGDSHDASTPPPVSVTPAVSAAPAAPATPATPAAPATPAVPATPDPVATTPTPTPTPTPAPTPTTPAATGYDAGVASLRALATFPIGVAVDGGSEARSLPRTTQEQAIVKKHFSQITPGNIMKMSYLHPSQDTYTFTQADELVNYATANGVAVHAHALIWHSDYQVPSFMKTFTGDKAAWLAMLDDHVQHIASHFAGKVTSWDVVNEALNDGGGFRQSLFYKNTGSDFIDHAFTTARAADPKALLYYNDYNIEADAAKLQSLTDLLDGLKARGVPIDGVGFQMHVYMDYPSVTQIKASLQKVVDRNLKVKISELDIPINNPYSAAYKSGDIKTTYTLALGLQQKKRYCEVVKAYMDTVPANLRGGVVIWGETDPSSWLIQALFNGKHDDWPLLFDAQYQDKPALRGVADALTGQACTAN